MPNNTRRQAQNDLDGDLDAAENIASMAKKDKPRRSLSSDLDASLVIGDKNWKELNTVHRRYDNFDDSESLMDDSFAGSSFASTQDSFRDEQEDAKNQFTALDDQSASSQTGGKALGGPSPRRNTPRRTYSKQKRTVPKKSIPMAAISEAGNDSSNLD